MNTRLLRLTTAVRHEGRRLDEVAREWLAEVLEAPPPRSAIRRLIMAGALRAHGQPLRAPGRVVEAGMDLALTLRSDLVRRRPAAVPLDVARILYEDDALVAVDKPAGLPTVATADPGRAHLVGQVEHLLRSRAGPGVRHPLGVHQRLDRDTSGVVLFVKDPAANAGLAAQFAAHTIEKTYLALTGRPRRPSPRTWRCDAPVDGPGPGAARPAVTDFRVVEAWPHGALVEARPRTGRKHQVRIHLSRAGLPILGDATYGGDPRAAPRMMLHAARLRLRHPLTGVELSVASPLPADFRAVLDRLRPAPAGSARRGRRPRRRGHRAGGGNPGA